MTPKERSRFSAEAMRKWRKDNRAWVEFVDQERKRSGGVLPAGWEKRYSS